MHVVVMGAGSLGSLIGGLLADAHEVTLVGRERHMRAIAANGLRITGELDRRAHPETRRSYPTTADVDICLVTVKATDTRTVANEIADSPPRTTVSLQNGLGNEEILREVLPYRTTVLAGTTTFGALLEEPGRVTCTGRGNVQLGDPEGGRSPVAEEIANAFEVAGIQTTAASDMPSRLWRKLAVNAGINPTTALARVQNGRVAEAPLQAIAASAARETAIVGERNGIPCDADAFAAETIEVAQRTATNTSSMARDFLREQRSEIDAINGAVVQRAGEVPTPVNQTLYGLVVARERSLGLRNAK